MAGTDSLSQLYFFGQSSRTIANKYDTSRLATTMSSLDASPSAFYTRSNKTVLGYCMIVGLAVVLYGLDTGEITGFLAMKRFSPPTL